MTHIDLLNYLIDVQKIEKAELAELLAIPLKKIDGVLCGQIPLKKKWLKNLSAFTGIPKETIVSGDFDLQYPAEAQEPQAEGEQTPVVPEQTPEMSENLKQYNYDKLMDFCKVRYKKRYRDIKQAVVIQIVFAILGLLFSIACGVFVVLQKPMTDILLFPLICFIPTFMALLSVGSLFKIAKNGSKCEEKNFKIYTLLSILPMLIHSVAGICFKVYPVWSIGLGVASFLPLIYLVLIKAIEKNITGFKIFLGIAFSFITTAAFLSSVFVGEFIERDTDTEILMACFMAIIASWGIVALTFVYVYYFYFCYHKVIVTSKFFQPLNEKVLLKKHHIRNKIIALVLAAIIFVGGTYILSCAIMYWNVDVMINAEDYPMPKYSEYDKSYINFTSEDDVVTIDNKHYTVKLPADMKKDEKITDCDTYKVEGVGGMVMIYPEDYLGNSLPKLYFSEDATPRENEIMAEYKQKIIDEYGFYPQSSYEIKKIVKDVHENGVDFWDRKQAVAVIPMLIFESTLAYDNEIIFYEDSEIEMVLTLRRTETPETKMTIVTCQVDANKKGDYNKDVNLNILLRSDYADEELAYKIINSIEMK